MSERDGGKESKKLVIEKKQHPHFSEAAILDFNPVGMRSIVEHALPSSVGLVCASSSHSYRFELRLNYIYL